MRTATLLAGAGALLLGTATPAVAAGPASWSPDLVAGETAGILVDGDTARLDAPTDRVPVEYTAGGWLRMCAEDTAACGTPGRTAG